MKNILCILLLCVGLAWSSIIDYSDSPIIITNSVNNQYSLEMCNSEYEIFNPEQYFSITMFGNSTLSIYGQNLQYHHNTITDTSYRPYYDRYNQGYITGTHNDFDYIITLGNFPSYIYPDFYPQQDYSKLKLHNISIPEPATLYLYVSFISVLYCKKRFIKV